MPEANEQQTSRNNEPHWVEKSTLFVLILTLVMLGIYTCETHSIRTATEDAVITAQQANINTMHVSNMAVVKDKQNAVETKRVNDESLRLTREGLELSRKSLIASQRAWLVPKYMVVTFNDNRTISVKFTVSNTGRSPATAIRGILKLFQEGMPETFEKLDRQTFYPNTLIAPGIDHDMTFTIPFKPEASLIGITAIKEGNIKSWFSGHFLYSDDYAVDRILPLCGLYKPNQPAYDECPVEYAEKNISTKKAK